MARGLRPSVPPADPRQGLLGLYSLALMEREGPVYGYRISERIAERTEGAWRPGPGAVYPSLQKLVARGLARARTEGRRREYAVTPAGRKLLRQIRERQSSGGASRLDLAVLWADIAGSGDLDAFLLGRLRRTLDLLTGRLARPDLPRQTTEELRQDVVRELSRSLERMERAPLVAMRMPSRRREAAR